MTAFLNSITAPEIQTPAHFSQPRRAVSYSPFDPIMPMWRAWLEATRIEAEAGRAVRRDDHFHQAWTARIRALEALVSFPGSSATALAARLHAAFHHAYSDALEIEKRDPVFRAQVAALTSLLPALPEDMAAEIERSIDGED